MTDLSELSSSAYWRVLQQDVDTVETSEWVDAFDALVEHEGRERATFILRKLLDRARARRVPLPPVLNTPYCNTISLAGQPQYPGNLEIEQRLSDLGMPPAPTTREEFDKFIRAQIAQWAQVIKDAGIPKQ